MLGAFVEEAKLRDYLLNLTHADGGSKAAFFIAFGFTRDEPDALRLALLEQANSHDAEEVASVFGKRYTVDAPIRTPSGRMPWVRSVWEVKDGPPRLVTAFPIQAKR